MKTYVVLILGFIQTVLCNQDLNFSNYDLQPSCPVTFFRRKRALAEYTRWQTNQETSSQFIVKVLDEDITTHNPKAVYGVNIQPAAKDDGERIIIGGALVPASTSKTLMTESGDYTRFVPPTSALTTPNRESTVLIPVVAINSHERRVPKISHRGTYVAPVSHHRDGSLPAGPQFIVRRPEASLRQYAPIEAVVFTTRVTLPPIKPTSAKNYDSMKHYTTPTRTTPLLGLIIPTRTKSILEDFRIFRNFGENTYTEPATFTNSEGIEKNVLIHETTTEEITKESFNSLDINKIEVTKRVESNGNKPEIGKIRDSDAMDNMLYYNEDDKEDGKLKNDNQLLFDYGSKFSTRGELEMGEDKDVKNSEPQELYIDDISLHKQKNSTAPLDSDGQNIAPALIEIETTTTDFSRGKREKKCSLLTQRVLSFTSPLTLHEITIQLKKWADNSPITKWVDITAGNLTTMENPIHMMIVDDPSSGQSVSAKQTVMIIAGIEGRDHHAVTSAMYVLYQLIEKGNEHKDLLGKYRFWVIPVFNPDGYEYSMTFPQRREWGKNLHQTWDTCKDKETCRKCSTHGIRCMMRPCYGVNLDRNFEYQWIPAEELRTEHPCGALYAGKRQLSEPETRALTFYLHNNRVPITTFLAFKEGEVLGIMYPYSHTKKKRAFDHIYRQHASMAAAAASTIAGRPYVAGQTSEYLPLYAGGIEDWIDGHLGIDNTYTIMMYRSSDSYNRQITTERVVHEAYAAMDTILMQSEEPLGPQVLTYSRTEKKLRSASKRLSPFLYLHTIISIYTIHRYL